MSITRFFEWPTIGAWIERRVWEWVNFDPPPRLTPQAALLLELCLNGYAVRRVR